jgi:hypothetical protein
MVKAFFSVNSAVSSAAGERQRPLSLTEHTEATELKRSCDFCIHEIFIVFSLRSLAKRARENND